MSGVNSGQVSTIGRGAPSSASLRSLAVDPGRAVWPVRGWRGEGGAYPLLSIDPGRRPLALVLFCRVVELPTYVVKNPSRLPAMRDVVRSDDPGPHPSVDGRPIHAESCCDLTGPQESTIFFGHETRSFHATPSALARPGALHQLHPFLYGCFRAPVAPDASLAEEDIVSALPIDNTRVSLMLASETVEEVPAYAELSDGSRRRVDGRQATDPVSGLPLFFVYVMLLGEPGTRPEMVRVKVQSATLPTLPGLFQPVPFEGLTCTPYVDSSSGRVALSWKAEGIRSAGSRSVSADGKAA